MSQRILFTTLLLGASLGLGGCKFLKKKEPDAAPSAAAASAAPAPAVPAAAAPEVAAPAAAPPLDETSVAASQDFEDEAFEKVTTANFKTELTRLTTEINAK